MAHDEPISKFRSLDKVRILLLGSHYVIAYHGPCTSLRFFDDHKSWQEIDFKDGLKRAIVIHECQPDSPILNSLREGRKASLHYGQYIVFDGEWTLSIPEYHLEKESSLRDWSGFKRVMAAIRKFSRSFTSKEDS